jgi:nucleotide-binding universal stress UspA family protein
MTTTMKRFRCIVHPSDFSSASRPALARAIGLARGDRARLLIVHVLSTVTPLMADGYMSPRTYDDLRNAVIAHGRRQLDRVIARARRAGVRVQGRLLEGVAADRIVRAARSERADVIVMGTHGRGGFAKLLLGSVAERVVATAPCPVLTVRGK